MAKISIIYHHFPHYRAPVMRALASSKKHDYHFYGSLNDFDGIKTFQGDDQVKINPIFFKKNSFGTMDISSFEEAISKEYDATIIIGHLKMPGTWKALNQAKRNGLKTALWAHGWLRRENYFKGKLRNYYFNKADCVLTYGARAINIAKDSGFPSEKIKVIWNSLDWEKQSTIYNNIKEIPLQTLRKNINMPLDKPILLTISRVTEICYYDWLIKAVANIRQKGGILPEVWMIGEGPALEELKSLARSLEVPLHSMGAIYDEEIIARHIMAANLVISPGKLGLTAMHALAYGTPAITHSNLDLQMPEIESIIEGKSGSLFKYDDIQDLANVIQKSLEFYSNADVRQNCRAALIGRFTPQDQCYLIDAAMDEVLNG